MVNSMDSRQESVSKGQAMNLALEIAVKEGRTSNSKEDNKFIIEQFVRMFKLIQYVQTNTLEDIIKKLGK